MKKCLIALVLLTACGGDPIGKLNPATLNNSNRIAFGKVTLAGQDDDTGITICFLDYQEKENCGTLLSQRKYFKYEENKQYYNYVIIALPPGKAKISKLTIGKRSIYSYSEQYFTQGLDFTVDEEKPATYFGDVTLLTEGSIVNTAEAYSEVKNNADFDLKLLKSINPSLKQINTYSTNLAKPLLSFKVKVTEHQQYMTPVIK